MMLIKSFFRRIINDFRHKELLPLKLIFFVQASTLYVLYPYLTIHKRELGINVEETAIMSAITPLTAIIMPPLAGLFADRIGNFKILLSLFSSLGGAAALLLLLVPVGRVTLQFPQRVVMDLSCPGTDGELVYSMNQFHPCETKLQANISTRIESCGYTCNVDVQNETDLKAILESRTWTVTYTDLEQGTNTTYRYHYPSDDLPGPPQGSRFLDDIREDTQMKNKELFDTTVRQLSRSLYYFPANRLYEFRCSLTTSSIEDSSNITSDDSSSRRNVALCEFDDFTNIRNENHSLIEYFEQMTKLKSIESNYIDRLEKKRRYLVEEISLPDTDYFNPVKCRNPDNENLKVSLNVALVNWTVSQEPYRNVQVEGCTKRCVLTAPRVDICSNKDTVVEYNVALTFWLYLAIRVFIGILGGTAFAMFEGAVIAILREQDADYGMQRIYGSIGGMISSPLSGLLIDYASRGKSYTDFRPAFYLYAGLKIASGVLMLWINLEFKSPANDVVGDVMSVLKNIDFVALLFACFVLGSAWGYIESFLFWLLQDLGGSRSLMGVTITVGGIAGIPLLVFSGPIIQKIGHANVLFIGFTVYAVRFLGYSLIYNPWLSLIFEALESVTASLSITAAVTYAAKLSTTSTDSSIQGLLGGVYYGVGRGAGSLIGGYLMKNFGIRPTYRIFAVVCLITGIIYFLYNALYLKKRRAQIEADEAAKKTTKKLESANQNGMENGDVDLAVRNEKKKLEADCVVVQRRGIDNKAFSTNIDDLETINNAKNLDRIEKLPECDNNDGRMKISVEDCSKASEMNEEKKNKVEYPNKDMKGVDNLGFSEETKRSDAVATAQKCNVTVEKQPDDDGN